MYELFYAVIGVRSDLSNVIIVSMQETECENAKYIFTNLRAEK